MDEGVKGIIAKFANDTIIGGKVTCAVKARRLQWDIHMFIEWAYRWLEVIHICIHVFWNYTASLRVHLIYIPVVAF